MHELLRTKGIYRPADLMHQVPGLSRQYAYLIWNGKREISRRLGRKLSEALGIPFGDIMAAESVTPATPPPRGRPKSSQSRQKRPHKPPP